MSGGARRSSGVACAISHENLRHTMLFATRNQRFLEQVTTHLEVELFVAGQELMACGDQGDKMYFLHRGAVEVLAGPDLQQVAVLNSGSVIGEMALFGQGRRTATVRALEFCDCRVISHKAFHWILRHFPEERSYFAKLAQERLEQLRACVKQRAGPAEEDSGPTLASVEVERAKEPAVVMPKLSTARPASQRVSRRDDSHHEASPALPAVSQCKRRRASAPDSLQTPLRKADGSYARSMFMPVHTKLQGSPKPTRMAERLKQDNAALRARVEDLSHEVLLWEAHADCMSTLMRW